MPIFGPLADQHFTMLEANARSTKFAAGQTIFAQDEPSDAVYKIASGVAKLDHLLSDGRRQVLGFALPGYFLGISMYPRRSFGAQAIGAVTALCFDLAIFKKMVLSTPAALRSLYELAQRELDASQELMMTVGRKNAEERVASFLVEFRERWEWINGASDKIPLPMTRTDIADYLGLTIETVSRTFSKLAHDRVVSVEHGAVSVIDSRRLAELARASPN